MTKEALKLGLVALETLMIERGSIYDQAITAIKEALANEALEKMAENARELGLDYEPPQKPYCYTYTENGEEYFAPPTAYVPDNATPLYTTPPQRTWVGLTDGEVDKMILLMGFPPDWTTENAIVKNIVRNLEAKLKEKNNG